MESAEATRDLLTIAEAAEHVGKPAWWLRRHVLAHEQKTGQVVFVRDGTGRKRPTYKVNMGRLRALCPELFDLREPLAEALRESAVIGRRAILDIKNDIDEINCKIDLLAEKLRAMSRR